MDTHEYNLRSEVVSEFWQIKLRCLFVSDLVNYHSRVDIIDKKYISFIWKFSISYNIFQTIQKISKCQQVQQERELKLEL